MKIGIDGRLINETGVGRYIRNIVAVLGSLDKENEYIIFLRRSAYNSLKLPNNRWQKRLADIPWHSFTEQLVMPVVFAAEKLDLLHVPYFNVPVFYPGKFVVTIHDLTILHFDTGRATTLPWLFYKIRRLGYYLALWVGLFRSRKIIAVSEATKKEIIDHFHIDRDKITVTYEGVDKSVISDKREVISKTRLIADPYFLYIGNAYPHKNLETLLKAFKYLSLQPQKVQPFEAKLVLVGAEDFFYRKLKNTVEELDLGGQVIFFGPANDQQLHDLYIHAEALVFPSFMEGFGLPGVEAMAVGTPVVCSDIPVFHEIYGDAALYFDPKNQDDIANKLQTIISDKKLVKSLVEKGKLQVKKYSWKEMAKKTLTLFQNL